jgi:hypothetical protein
VPHQPLLLVLLAGGLIASHAAAQDNSAPATLPETPPAAPLATESAASKRPARFTFFIENDGAIKPNDQTDRYYTSGVKIDLAFQPDWARSFADFIPLGADFDPERTAFGVSATQLIFTPWKNGRSLPPPNDHPYAGYLYGSVYFQRAEAPATERADQLSTFDHLQFDFGMVGPSSLAQESQDEVHRIIGRRLLNGWNHQLKDEPSFNMTYRRKVRLEYALDDNDLKLQLIPEAGFDVGTVWRQAVGGVTLRIGQNLPDDYGASRLLLSGAAVATPRDGLGWEVYFRGEGRAVQHDIFLDGNTWRESAHVDKYSVVGELTFGGVLHINRNVEIGYSQTFQTEQFHGQDGMHSWGSLFIRALWTF